MKTAQQLVAAAKAQINEIDVQQLAALTKQAEIVLIDVREPDEFTAGHIAHSINYPRGVLEMRIHQHPKVAAVCDTLQALTTLADEPIYLLCRSGARSVLAAQSLQAMGFHKVYSVEGGFQAWLDAGYPVSQ